MADWYGSLNIDGIQECSVMGSKDHVIREINHYYMMYMEEVQNASKRITMTIQKGKSEDE